MSDRVDRDLERLFALDNGPGPAPPISAARADALVVGALDAAGFPPPGSAGPAAAGGAGKWIAATALLAGAGVAFYFATRAPEVERLAAPTFETPVVSEAEPSLPPPAESPPAIVFEPTLEIEPEDGLKIERSQQAEDLLAEANAARGKKNWKKADRLYSRVAKEYPKTASAQIALVASGHLHLEHLKKPAKAVSLFQKAAKSGGPVAEEARYGLAEAYRAVGDKAKEAEALETFVARYPDSPLADRARARLKVLR